MLNTSNITLLPHNTPIPRDRNDLPRKTFTAGSVRILRCSLKTATARHFHPHYGYTLDGVVGQNGSQFFCVVYSIQLGAADQRDSTTHKVLVKIGVGIGGAICSKEKISTFKEWGFFRKKLDLAWPLP